MVRVSAIQTVLVAAALGWAGAAAASEQVYRPTNPTFGGSGLNGSFLLSTAQAQGKGVKSGQNSPDLSGLNDSLKNIGSGTGQVIIIPGTTTSGGGTGTTTVPTSP